MTVKFDRAVFETAFATSLQALAGSERVTKAELQGLSRTVLEAVHATGDIAYVNKILDVLSPVNKKVAITFFKFFTGFSVDEATNRFTTKSKKRYDKALEASLKFLEDPLNNIWSWAARNIEITQKDFSLADVTKATERFIKKAKENKHTELDVLRAMFAGGLTPELLIQMLGEVGYDVNTTEEPAKTE